MLVFGALPGIREVPGAVDGDLHVMVLLLSWVNLDCASSRLIQSGLWRLLGLALVFLFAVRVLVHLQDLVIVVIVWNDNTAEGHLLGLPGDG